jgi:hypothetical protein
MRWLQARATDNLGAKEKQNRLNQVHQLPIVWQGTGKQPELSGFRRNATRRVKARAIDILVAKEKEKDIRACQVTGIMPAIWDSHRAVSTGTKLEVTEKSHQLALPVEISLEL